MKIEELYEAVQRQFDQHHHIAHGVDHVQRVAQTARHIAEQENYAFPLEAEIAGLLHDIGRTVQEEEKDHGPAGVIPAKRLLDSYTNYDDLVKERILNAIRDHSNFSTEALLSQIIQDADRIDGLGAIGLMRAYTSCAQLPAFDPENIIPTKGMRGTNIHDQLAFQLEWVAMMSTKSGRAIAEKRALVMRDFLQTFKEEVEEKDF